MDTTSPPTSTPAPAELRGAQFQRATPPRRKRFGCLRRLVILGTVGALGLVLSALLLLVLWLQTDDFQRRASALAEREIERQTGEQLSLTHVRINFLPPGVEVDGFHLFSETTGETVASAERVRVPLVLAGGGLQIGRIRVQRPFVNLHLDEQGKLVEFRNRARSTTQGRPLERLPFTSLEVSDAEVRLSTPDGFVALEDLTVTPSKGSLHGLKTQISIDMHGYREVAPLRWEGVRLGPDTIEIPHLELDTRMLDLSGQVTLPLQGDVDVALSGTLQLEPLTDVLPDPWATHGLVDLDLGVTGPAKNPTLALNALGTTLGVDRPGRFGLLTYEVGDVVVAATATRDRIDVEDLTLLWGGGTIRATALIDPASKTVTDLRAIGDGVSLHDMLQAFDAAPTPWIDLAADAEVRASGSLDPFALDGEFDFAVADLKVGDRPVRDPAVQWMLDIPHAWARGDIHIDKDHLVFEAHEIEGPRTRASATVDIGFKPHGPLDLTADVHHADLSDFQPLRGVELSGTGRVAGRIWGPFDKLRFEGLGDIENFSVLDIPWADRLTTYRFRSPDMKSIELLETTATRGGSSYGGDFVFDFKPPMSMKTRIAMGDGRIEDILSAFIDLPGFTGDMKGTLELEGPIFDMNGQAHFEYADVDFYGEHFETGEGHGFMNDGLFTLDDLRLLRNASREGLILRGSVQREWALNMDLVGDGFTLQTLDSLADADLPLSGKVDLVMHIDNTLFDPAPHGRLRIRDVRYASNPVDDSVLRFTTRNGVLTHAGSLFGDAVEVGGTLGLWDEQPYRIHADLDRFPAHVFYPTAADGSPIQAVATGSVDVSGHFGADWSPVRLNGVCDDCMVDWSGHHLTNTAPWRYAQFGEAFTLTDFALEGGQTRFAVNATRSDQLELDGEGVLDLDLLRALVPGLQRAEGTADVTLEAVGRRPDVQTTVDIDVDARLLRYESIPVAFEDVTARLQLTRDAFEVVRAEGGLGGGRGTLSGQVHADHWSPKRFDLQADITDAQVQWVDTLPPAIGDARLSFDGPVDALLLGGEVVIEDMQFRDRIDWEDWVVEYRSEILVDSGSFEEVDPWFDLNVHLSADETIRLRNNLAEAVASADLRLVGDTSQPGITGWVRVVDGIVILQDREFRVDRGEISYNDPWTWDPDVDFDLITDIDSRNRRYRVNYQVFGPFSDWRTSTRSDPALPQADVNALLWFGVTTDELEESGELPAAVAQGVADLILTDLFASTQASELGEVPELLFDRIDLTTGVNARGEYSSEPRLVVEKRLEEVGDIDVTWEFNLGRPEDNYIRFDKRVGGVWSIAGWYATLQRDRVLRIGGAYGVDVTARWESD